MTEGLIQWSDFEPQEWDSTTLIGLWSYGKIAVPCCVKDWESEEMRKTVKDNGYQSLLDLIREKFVKQASRDML